MATRRRARTEFVGMKDSALILSGPPHAIRGSLRLRNATKERIVARGVELRGAPEGRAKAKGKGKDGEGDALGPTPLPGSPIALRRIVLRQGQTREIPLSLQLDRATPPGTYRAELVVDDQPREVVVHVTEHVSLSLSPEELVLPNRPGETIEKEVVLVNEGNVPITVPPLGAIVLDEDLAHCRALRGALAEVGGSMETLDEFASALGRQYAGIYESLFLKVKNAATTVEPGATVVMELAVSMPSKLDARLRYTCAAPVVATSISFVIVPEA